MDILFYGSFWIFSSMVLLLLGLLSAAISFWYRARLQSLLGDIKSEEDLAAKIRAEENKIKYLEDEVKKCTEWLGKNKEELFKVESERKTQELLRSEIVDVQNQLATLKNDYQNKLDKMAEMDSTLRTISELNNKIDLLKKEAEKLEDSKKTFDSIKAEISNKTKELEKIGEELKTKTVSVQSLEKDIKSLNNEMTDLKEKKETVSRQLEGTLKDKNSLLDTMSLKQNELKETTALLQKKSVEIEDKNKVINALKNDILDRERQSKLLREDIDRQNKTIIDNKTEVGSLDSKKQALLLEIQKDTQLLLEKEKEKHQLENLKSEYNTYSAQLAGLEIECKKYSAEVEALKIEIEKERNAMKVLAGTTDPETPEKEIERYQDLFIVPDCLKVTYSGKRTDTTNEIESLQKVQEYFKSCNLQFSNRILYSFHTALKISHISPFSVLAGISGTGKTLLPIKYAEAMGIQNIVVSVQPRWDSPQDLFGFYNYLEKKYKATDFVRSLIIMDEYNFKEKEASSLEIRALKEKMKDRMLLVLLDEMNLARIEYYFSEFLSKLEIKRQIDPKNANERFKGEIKLDEKYHLWIGDNVLLAGTMNEDESTHALSDKVLDRANVLRFAKPSNSSTLNNNSQTHKSNENYLSFSEWMKWKKNGDNQFFISDINGWIHESNKALEFIGRPFGYRVEQAIRAYVINYPGVEVESNYKKAFADQIEQKILPKFRGIDISLPKSQEALEILGEIIEKLDDGMLRDEYRKSMENDITGMFEWRGVNRQNEK